jgi:hypothetical protein
LLKIYDSVCREEGISSWWSTSARTGDHVEEGFKYLVSKILEEDVAAEVRKMFIEIIAKIC